jgi:hypothetical protein
MQGIVLDCERTNEKLRGVYQHFVDEGRDLHSPSGVAYKASTALTFLNRICPESSSSSSEQSVEHQQGDQQEQSAGITVDHTGAPTSSQGVQDPGGTTAPGSAEHSVEALSSTAGPSTGALSLPQQQEHVGSAELAQQASRATEVGQNTTGTTEATRSSPLVQVLLASAVATAVVVSSVYRYRIVNGAQLEHTFKDEGGVGNAVETSAASTDVLRQLGAEETSTGSAVWLGASASSALPLGKDEQANAMGLASSTRCEL